MSVPASLVDTMKFFDMSSAEYRTEWAELTDQDKAEIREGIGNGSLTY
ncbi:MAG TPA: hypothetical protein VGF75_05075 [Candidatus Saccharimonadales bacterium]